MFFDRYYLELHYLHYQKKGHAGIDPYQLLQDCLLSHPSILQVDIGIQGKRMRPRGYIQLVSLNIAQYLTFVNGTILTPNILDVVTHLKSQNRAAVKRNNPTNLGRRPKY